MRGVDGAADGVCDQNGAEAPIDGAEHSGKHADVGLAAVSQPS